MIVSFEQDPSKELGWGNFKDEQGRSSYAYDPQTAGRFITTMPGAPAPVNPLQSAIAQETEQLPAVQASVQMPQPGPDLRLAANEGATGTAAGAAPAVSPVVRTAAPTTALAPAANALASLGKVEAKLQSKPTSKTASPSSPMVETGRHTTTSVQNGRDARSVQADVDAVNANTDNLAEIRTGIGEQRAASAAYKATNQSAQDNQGYFDSWQDAQQKQAERDANLQAQAQKRAEVDPEVDPDRYIKEMSTGSFIATAILAALNGGFGAIIGKKNNDVIDMLDRKIDADIKTQRDQIDSGRIRRNNDLAKLVNDGYNLDDAIKIAKASKLNYAAKFWEDEANLIDSQQHKDQAALDVAQLRANASDTIRSLKASGEDRTASNTERTFQNASAAAPKLDDVYKQNQIEQQQLEELDANQVAKDLGSARPISVKRAAKAVDDAKDISTKMSRVDKAKQQAKALLKAAGVPEEAYDPSTGAVDWSMVDDLSGVGPLDSTGGLQGAYSGTGAYPASQNVRDAAQSFRESITYMTTGATATKEQQKVFSKQAGEDISNENAFRANVDRSLQDMKAFEAATLAASEDGRKIYETNRNRNNGASAQEAAAAAQQHRSPQTPSLKPWNPTGSK